MEPEDLRALIAQLRAAAEAEGAPTPDSSIYLLHDTDTAYLEANPTGIQVLAADLLSTLLKRQASPFDKTVTEPLTVKTSGDVQLQFIECGDKEEEKKGANPIFPPEEKARLIKIGCAGMALAVAYVFIVGLITIVRWVFFKQVD